MRIPATRIPLGFKGSDPGDLGLDGDCADIDKGDVQAVAAKAAEYPRNVLRFIFHRILVDGRPGFLCKLNTRRAPQVSLLVASLKSLKPVESVPQGLKPSVVEVDIRHD
jgi:hypothetical protein